MAATFGMVPEIVRGMATSPATLQAGCQDLHAAASAVIVAPKTLSTYFNHINETDPDLPAVPDL